MKYIYEFIGTFFLVLTVGMTTLNPGEAGIMAPLAIGSILAVMIFAGGHISGGHYNPAVSLAVFMRRQLKAKELWLYWIVQLVGGVLAGLLTLWFKGMPPTESMLKLMMGKLFLVEFLFTFALCFVVLNVAATKQTKGNSYFGLAIGFTVLAGAYAVGALSSAAFNPAVALGTSVMQASAWAHLWVYFLANLLGGACAALVFIPAHQEK